MDPSDEEENKQPNHEFSGVLIQNIVEESKEVAIVEVEEIIATFRQ